MENTYHGNTEETGYKQKDGDIGMVDRFIIAMFSPKEYDKLLKLKTGKIIGYLILLLLLATVIQYVIPILGAIAGMGGIKGIIMNEIPDFSLQDGSFYLSERLEQEDEYTGIYMLVDTEVEKFTKEDIPEDLMEAVMVSSTNILVYNNVAGLGGILQEETFDHYKEITVNNEVIASQAPVIYGILFIVLVGIYIFVFIKYLLSALFYSILIYLLTRTMVMNLTFGKTYKIALCAQSIGTIVSAVVCCLNISAILLFGSLFSVAATVVIINRALAHMQEDSFV